MNHRLKPVAKTYWTFIWLITATVVLVSLSTYAAYNGGAGRVKRVVTTRAGVTSHFSANYLSVLESSGNALPGYRTMIIPQGAEPERLRICNYPQGYKEGFPDYKILYTLKAVLYDERGTAYTANTFPASNDLQAYYIVRFNSDNTETKFSFQLDENGNYSLTIDKEKKNDNQEVDLQLPGNQASDDEFRLVFQKNADGAYLTNVYMHIVAEPRLESDETNTMLNPIGAILNMEYAANKIDTNWTGTISEASGAYRPSYYDGFNYVVTGTGEGTITLIWDPSKIGINQYYKENNKSSDSEGDLVNNLVAKSGKISSDASVSALVNDAEKSNWSFIQFDVSSEIVNNITPLDRYVFQMYKVGNATDEMSWSELYGLLGSNAAIQFSFEKNNQDDLDNEQTP